MSKKHYPCDKEDLLNVLFADIAEIKKDVKTLIRWVWFILGGSAMVGFLAGFAIQLLNK